MKKRKKKINKKTTLLIDGDILIYSVCSATEYVARFDEDTDVVFGNVQEAMARAEGILKGWITQLDAEFVVLGFTGSENYRKEVYPMYKSHRKSCRKPCGYKVLKELFHSNYCVKEEAKLEGDDIIGILQTEKTYQNSIIISSDKDLKCIPGMLFNPDKDETPTMITLEEANRNWLTQTLTGDKTDGYPGLEGVGPVTAAKILKEGKWSEVLQAYENLGYTEEYALTQARCARILRHGEYNWDTKEISLWQP
jgi:DNA polymerase-1